jgi:hypothetical protein
MEVSTTDAALVALLGFAGAAAGVASAEAEAHKVRVSVFMFPRFGDLRRGAVA